MNTKKNLRAVMLMLFLCACQRTPEASSRPEDLSFSSLSSFRSSVSSTQSIQSSSSSLSSVSSSISSSSSVQSSAASSGSSSSAASSGISSQPEAPVSVGVCTSMSLFSIRSTRVSRNAISWSKVSSPP